MVRVPSNDIENAEEASLEEIIQFGLGRGNLAGDE